MFLILTRSLTRRASGWSGGSRRRSGPLASSSPSLPLARPRSSPDSHAQLSSLSLLLLSLALVALVRDRRFLAGVVIGLMVFKPQLGVVVALVMILAGEWRVVAGAALARQRSSRLPGW